MSKNFEIATFAGGCFWCMEEAFEQIYGVIEVISGYANGNRESPSYEEVCSGVTGHYEAVQVKYDPSKVSYEELLAVFWMHIDPTDPDGQFADKGGQYRTSVLYHSEEQRKLAERTKRIIEESKIFGEPVVNRIEPFKNFYPAEEYHQDFYKKNPIRYCYYKTLSGREGFIKEIWEKHNLFKRPRLKLNEKYMKKRDLSKLTPLEYRVTQECGTEPPFNNKYWDNKQEGIYVDIVSGEPLFASIHKFDSKTGWPSFYQTIEPDNIVYRLDISQGMMRIEVRSRHGDSHLGHLFDDGPDPTGLRYCINSAALRFISVEDLEKEGYGEYKKIFEKRRD